MDDLIKRIHEKFPDVCYQHLDQLIMDLKKNKITQLNAKTALKIVSHLGSNAFSGCSVKIIEHSGFKTTLTYSYDPYEDWLEIFACKSEKSEKKVAKLANTEIDNFSGSTDYEQEITCPHCGDKNENSWEYTDEADTVECEECGNKFTYQRHVEITFSTVKE